MKMANFISANDDLDEMIKVIEGFANKDDVYQEMISAGQEIMKNAIETGARQHKITGKMANSLVCTKPMKNKSGDWVGRVKFEGTKGVYKTKKGKQYDITNWLKAFRIEYGTSQQVAKPFVRPAIQKCQSNIYNKMDKIFEREMKQLQ